MDKDNLSKKYPQFIFDKYEYALVAGDLVINFYFSCATHDFKTTVTVKQIDLERFKTLNENVLKNLIFNLGLTEIPTYWKAFASPEIIINAGGLSPEQVLWWEELFIKGMGQYFYENKIDFTVQDILRIKSTGSEVYSYFEDKDLSGILIPVGGGKDSAVSLELLKNINNSAVFLLNPIKASLEMVKVSGINKAIVFKREIDPKLIELNKQGFLNGHTPFSSVIAFETILAGYLFGIKEVAISNERSSDEENTEYLGFKINHQYSKTLEFENKFRDYVQKYLLNVNYFSFLRPLYDLQIAKLFSRMPQYFGIFLSCNIGQKNNAWCGNCSKCLSTYILLKPFLEAEELKNIFGSDLTQKPELKNTLEELINDDLVKPFECVGTREELRQALSGEVKLINEWNMKNNLPAAYEEIIKREIQK
jgi:hypothetical protein